MTPFFKKKLCFRFFTLFPLPFSPSPFFLSVADYFIALLTIHTSPISFPDQSHSFRPSCYLCGEKHIRFAIYSVSDTYPPKEDTIGKGSIC